MNLRNTLIFNTLGLPVYWAECHRARAAMDVTVTKQAYGNHARQYALVVRGKGSRPEKTAFYFHGGGWTFGRPETFVPAALPWLAAGYTVVLPSYRRPPRFGMAEVVADCRAALAAFAVPGGDWQIGGISAGAHLAALLALTPASWAAFAGPPRRVLLCAGPLCLTRVRPSFLFGGLAEFDPYAQLTEHRAASTWLLLHGTADALVSAEHSRRFLSKLHRVGQPATLHLIPDGTHLDSGRWMFGGAAAQTVRQFIEGAAAGAEKG